MNTTTSNRPPKGRVVFVTFVAKSTDPFSFDVFPPPADAEEIVDDLYRSGTTEALERAGARYGPILTALLADKSPFELCPDSHWKKRHPNYQGPFQRIVLLWNPLEEQGKEREIEKNAHLVKKVLEQFVQDAEGMIDVVEYPNVDSRDSFDRLVYKIKREVEGERSNELTRFCFLLGSGLAQTLLAPVELAQNRRWRGRFAFWMYGKTGGFKGQSWDVSTLFEVLRSNEPRDPWVEAPLRAILDTAMELDREWEWFLRALLAFARDRKPIALVGGDVEDHEWHLDWLLDKLLEREGEWRGELKTVRKDEDVEALFDARGDGLRGIESARLIWIPPKVQLGADALALLSRASRFGSLDEVDVADPKRPCLIASEPADGSLEPEWEPLELPRLENQYLLSAAWRRVVEHFVRYELVESTDQKEIWSYLELREREWCAPCRRWGDEKKFQHTCIEERLKDESEATAIHGVSRLLPLCAALERLRARHTKSPSEPVEISDEALGICLDEHFHEWRR